jgi:hypothetical protein
LKHVFSSAQLNKSRVNKEKATSSNAFQNDTNDSTVPETIQKPNK